MKPLWIASIIAVGVAITVAIACLIAAAWWSDDRFGGIGAILGFSGVIGGLCLSIWSLEQPWRSAPRLDRAGRRELRSEQRRIALAKAIADAEREAGIR